MPPALSSQSSYCHMAHSFSSLHLCWSPFLLGIKPSFCPYTSASPPPSFTVQGMSYICHNPPLFTPTSFYETPRSGLQHSISFVFHSIHKISSQLQALDERPSEPLGKGGGVCTLLCHPYIKQPYEILSGSPWTFQRENFHPSSFETSLMRIHGLRQEGKNHKIKSDVWRPLRDVSVIFLTLTVIWRKLDPMSLSFWCFPNLTVLFILGLEKFLLNLSASFFLNTGSWIIYPICYDYLPSITFLHPWQDKGRDRCRPWITFDYMRVQDNEYISEIRPPFILLKHLSTSKTFINISS